MNDISVRSPLPRAVLLLGSAVAVLTLAATLLGRPVLEGAMTGMGAGVGVILGEYLLRRTAPPRQ